MQSCVNSAKGDPLSALQRPPGLCVFHVGAKDPNPCCTYMASALHTEHLPARSLYYENHSSHMLKGIVEMKYWMKNGLQKDPSGDMGLCRSIRATQDIITYKVNRFRIFLQPEPSEPCRWTGGLSGRYN